MLDGKTWDFQILIILIRIKPFEQLGPGAFYHVTWSSPS